MTPLLRYLKARADVEAGLQQVADSRARRAFKASAEHTCWVETPNLYVERDLGTQTICGQTIKCRHVIDTAGTTFFVVSDAFRLPS